MVMTHTHAKGQSFRKIEWTQPDGHTDGGNCITSRANAVVKYFMHNLIGLWFRQL